MGAPERDCPHCGAAVHQGVRFCGECGQQIPDSGPAQGAMARTMLGIEQTPSPVPPNPDVSAPQDTQASEPDEPDVPASVSPTGKNPMLQQTMLGFTPSGAPDLPASHVPASAPEPSVAAKDASAPPAKNKSMAHTMLGVAPSTEPGAPAR